jgi:hypothetical protein
VDQGYVLIGSSQAHPTRILAKPIRPNPKLNRDTALAGVKYKSSHQFSGPAGWVLLDTDGTASRKPVKPEEAVVKGAKLQATIDTLRQSGLLLPRQ